MFNTPKETREAFEAWAIKQGIATREENGDLYMYGSTSPWTVWQAALSKAPVQAEPVALDDWIIEPVEGARNGAISVTRPNGSFLVVTSQEEDSGHEYLYQICRAMLQGVKSTPAPAQDSERMREALPPCLPPKYLRWDLDADDAKFLADLINGSDEPTPITLSVGFCKDDDGKIEYGLRVHETEYPEEGASMLVEMDCAALSTTPAQAGKSDPTNSVIRKSRNTDACKPAEPSEKVLRLLEEARDDVAEVLSGLLPRAGYPKYDRRIAIQRDLLERIDACLTTPAQPSNESYAQNSLDQIYDALVQHGMRESLAADQGGEWVCCGCNNPCPGHCVVWEPAAPKEQGK